MIIGDTFRAACRPIVTVIFAATIAQVVTQGIDAPDWFLGLAIPVILWWFGERTVGRIRSSCHSGPFAFCHSEGAERPKNLAQDKLREESHLPEAQQ